MFDIALTHGTPDFYLFSLFVFTFLLHQGFCWVFFARLAFRKKTTERVNRGGVSVVICARNEYESLKENLPLILDQDYPDFEVVVVNWSSDDDSSFLLTRMSEEFPRLKVVEIKENLNFFSGKKFPLSIGIKSAKNDMILVTNADCKPSGRNWLSSMRSGFSGKTEIVLGYSSVEKKKGFLNKIVRFENVHLAFRYLSFALAGIPYMGVGRNMGYLKSLFYKNQGFISHYRINSGDDDLFINKVASRKNTKVVLDPESFTNSGTPRDFRHWMIQKRSQVSTLRFYRSGHRLLLALYSTGIFLFYLLFIALLIRNYNPVLVLPVFLTGMIIQVFIFYKGMERLKEKDLFWLVPFFEVLLIMLYALAYISNFFSKRSKWK